MTRFPQHHDETVGGSGPGDSVPDGGANDTESSSKMRKQAALPLAVQAMPRWSAFVGVDKTGQSLKVQGVVSDWSRFF